jgi:16S rRNA (cytosine1402-N4)-methyltransferase
MNDGQQTKHIPVLVEEVMMLLRCQPDRTYIDATLGGGGHASEILRRTAPDGMVIGLDWDEEAISEAKRALMPFGERAKIFHANFIHIGDVLREMSIEQVDGILLDLGLSSFQLEKEARGFSFRGDGPLDMRMDRRIDRTASDLINSLSERELEETLVQYGEERWAKWIAKAILRERMQGSIKTTQALSKIVRHAIPRKFHPRKIDPATRTFQALRIHVNDELENLRKILETGWRFLCPGGRMCIISFHSLEDRIVKESFQRLEKGKAIGLNPLPGVSILTKKPVTPSEEEKRKNPRSRSAKLRCAEKV